MPTLESTEKIAPKSILRHRPIGGGVKDTRGATSEVQTTPPVVARASRPATNDTTDVVTEWQRNNAKGEKTALRTKQSGLETTWLPRPKLALTKNKVRQRRQVHPMFYLGVGMTVALLVWMIISAFIGWFTTVMDDIHYGRPRTFQIDAWVGHNEQSGTPSHFIALNLNRHIEIIELPGGDASHARVYMGPQLYGANDDLTPVTLKFIDVNHNHKPDMLVTFQATHIVFINDQGEFRPVQPSDQAQAEQVLQYALRENS